MDKPRRGPVSQHDWKSQHSQLGAVLGIKSQEAGLQGLPLSRRLLSLAKPQRFRRPRLQQPANLHTAGRFTGLAWTLNSEAGLPRLLGPVWRLHGAVHQTGGRSWRWGETASNGRGSQRYDSLFLHSAPARGLGSWSQEENQERAVSAGRAGAGSLRVAHRRLPGQHPLPGAPVKSSRTSSRKGQSS